MGDGPFDKEPRRGPIALGTSKQQIVVNEVVIPPSGPADPRQRVQNARRTAEPYVDLVQEPVLTGTYFEKDGRYRLFINHVGSHIECLLTLVDTDLAYHEPKKGVDTRLPTDWGVTGMLGPKPRPLAYRFAGDLVGGVYELYVPSWIGSYKLSPELFPGLPNDLVGHLTAISRRKLEVVFELSFYGRWPATSFSQTADNTIVTIASKHDDQPVLLDRYLGHAKIPYAMRTRYWFQLTPSQRSEMVYYERGIHRTKVRVDPESFRLVESGGREMNLFHLLMAERELEPGHLGSMRRNAIVTAIDAIVKRVFDYPIAPARAESKRLGQADLQELRVRILRILDAWHLPPSQGLGKESFGTALQRLLDGASERYAKYTSCMKYLGLGPRGYRKFRYEIKIELLELIEFDSKENEELYEGAKTVWNRFKQILEEAAEKKSKAFSKYNSVSKYLPLTYLVGHATVEFKGVVAWSDPNDEPEEGEPIDPSWTAEFGVALAGIEWSKSAGSGTTINWKGVTEIWGASPPTKEELEGAINYTQAELFAGIKQTPKEGDEQGTWDGELGGSKSFLAFFGRNFESPLTFWFDGELAEKGKGAAVAGQSLGGWAWLLAGQDADIDLAPKGKVLKDFDTYWRSRIAQVGVHFPINGARLPEPTRRESELMKADNLLTVKEALNAFAACELPFIAHPLAAIAVEGYADPPDDPTSNLILSLNRARTVRNYLMGIVGSPLTWGLDEFDLTTTGRLTADGHGEPDAPAPKRGKEAFDPLLRRVDVTVFLRDGVDVREKADAEPTVKLVPPRK